MVSSTELAGDVATVAPKISAQMLAELVGTELLAPVATMQGIVNAFAQSRELSLEQAQELNNTIHTVRALAERSRQIGSLITGRTGLTSRLVNLDEVVHGVVDDYSATFDELGLSVRTTIKPARVVGDPALTRELVKSVIEWAMDNGRVVSFMTQPTGVPEHSVLAATIRHQSNADGTQSSRPLQDSLSWQVVSQCAHLMGVPVNRAEAKGGYVLVVDFPAVPDSSEVIVPDGTDQKPWWPEA